MNEMETLTIAPVTFTEGAVKEIKRLMNEVGFDTTQYLRVGVKGGGCSGMTYVLGFDKKEDNDEIFEIDGINSILNPAHGIYLTGMEIEWDGGVNS